MKSPKKSETLEVRLAHETKQSFMERCRQQGQSASDVVRAAIEAYLDPAASSKRPGALALPNLKIAGLSTAILIAGAVAAGLLAVRPSNAHPDLAGTFAAMDANHDGVVSAEEFQAGQRSNDIYIIRHDGGAHPGAAPTGVFTLPLHGSAPATPPPGAVPVSPAERRALALREFALADADGDGRLTLAEMTARHRAIGNQAFVALDANGDGRITQREFAALFAPQAAPPPLLAHHFQDLDDDHDGVVTLEEFAES
jgi:Ca2+-binding EF-hand superfamily protein